MNEPCGFFHKIPSGQVLIKFVKELCGFFHKMPGGQMLIKFVKEPTGFIQTLPDGQIDGLFLITFSINPAISLRSKWWAFFEKSLNLPTG